MWTITILVESSFLWKPSHEPLYLQITFPSSLLPCMPTSTALSSTQTIREQALLHLSSWVPGCHICTCLHRSSVKTLCATWVGFPEASKKDSVTLEFINLLCQYPSETWARRFPAQSSMLKRASHITNIHTHKSCKKYMGAFCHLESGVQLW